MDTVVTDSNTAYGSFRREGVISSAARAILSKYKPSGKSHRTLVDPGSFAGNTFADYHAQEMSFRAEHEPEELLHPVASFQDITQMYREERRRLPEPHSKLTRQQHTILRRVQAGSLAHPILNYHDTWLDAVLNINGIAVQFMKRAILQHPAG
ncbi:hypothetical protein HPB50_012663 [Hyalomma asiaticum]|uniref:Uncharacterized protein n=1 Tax=Hyalomma asiaticum TaxID=266040 RepID=A0ACB7TAB5_HYAAI|nr:hypothetical protein HPB50_012663 [Hyalomma asiaticum]